MLDVVRAICPGGILDFGCGDGMFTQKLACEGGQLPALIFLLIHYQNAQRQFVRSDARHLPLINVAGKSFASC
jgi:hypothetical protein